MVDYIHSLLIVVSQPGAWHGNSDPLHRRLEKCAVFGHLYGRQFCTDEFYTELVEDAVFGDRNGSVQGCLAT